MIKLGKDCRVDAQFHDLEQRFQCGGARVRDAFHRTPSLTSLRSMLDG